MFAAVKYPHSVEKKSDFQQQQHYENKNTIQVGIWNTISLGWSFCFANIHLCYRPSNSFISITRIL